MIGQIINYRYEVLEKIGDGDIFSAYKSRDKVLNRLVTLKVLSKELAENADFAGSVLAGYRTAAVLDHPNVARVLDADPESNERFVTCEYVRGINVKERIRRAGPIAVPLALDIAIGMLEALEYAHANRMIHGNLRPQDVVVSPDGEVKVTDFGLSWALGKHPEIADKHAMRSVHYEAPEIAEGAAPSASSDLYSAGVIFYEMLTGVLPFEGNTAVAVAIKQSKEAPVPPRSINTGVPKSLSDLILRAIQRSPGSRYRNASEMLADLRAMRDAIRLGKPLTISQPNVSAKESKPEEHEELSEEAETSVKKLLVWLMLLFIVVVAVATLSVTLYLQGDRSGIHVPVLLGKTWDEAAADVEDAGLRLTDGGQAYSNSYAEGQICSVIPPTGTVVQPGTPIRVKISRGPSRKPIPDFAGLPEAEAYKLAAKEEFSIAKVTGEYSDTVPVNSVISQKPEAGIARAPGSQISLVVSLGPKPQPVEPSDTRPSAQERTFNIAVEVPDDVEGLQEVRILVNDDRGEAVAYQRYHEPGDKFTEPVITYGTSVRIRVYVGEQLANDDRY